MSQELKKRIEGAFQNIKDTAARSSLADMRGNISAAVDGARASVNEHIDDFQRANAKVDPVADRLLTKAKESEYSVLWIAFLFLSGVGAGFGLHHYLF